MRFASLGSGSKGNATLVETGDTCLLIDCGFTVKETELRLARLDKQAGALDGILVTHEHSDHMKGVAALARKYNLPVYLTAGTYHQGKFSKLPRFELINSHQAFAINGIRVQPVPVPHDAREPCQFVFDDGVKKIGVLTDLGSLTPFIEQQYSGLDALLLECNHDLGMLEQGPYPYHLKQRVGGDYGHLNNVQAGQLLKRIDLGQMQHLVLSHISQQNNTPELAAAEVTRAVGCSTDWYTVADQYEGFAWRSIS